jgi:hypothetical protein
MTWVLVGVVILQAVCLALLAAWAIRRTGASGYGSLMRELDEMSRTVNGLTKQQEVTIEALRQIQRRAS